MGQQRCIVVDGWGQTGKTVIDEVLDTHMHKSTDERFASMYGYHDDNTRDLSNCINTCYSFSLRLQN